MPAKNHGQIRPLGTQTKFMSPQKKGIILYKSGFVVFSYSRGEHIGEKWAEGWIYGNAMEHPPSRPGRVFHLVPWQMSDSRDQITQSGRPDREFSKKPEFFRKNRDFLEDPQRQKWDQCGHRKCHGTPFSFEFGPVPWKMSDSRCQITQSWASRPRLSKKPRFFSKVHGGKNEINVGIGCAMGYRPQSFSIEFGHQITQKSRSAGIFQEG